MAPFPSKRGWTFFTDHAHVLLCVARDPDMRLRDLALEVGITERAAQRIVRDLADADYITRLRCGRRNRYTSHLERPLRHRLEAHRAIGDVIGILDADADSGVRRPPAARPSRPGSSKRPRSGDRNEA